jgi:hypothetical protein
MAPLLLLLLAAAARAPEIISPEDGACFHLDAARGANFALQLRNPQSARTGFRIVIIGIGQRLDQFLDAQQDSPEGVTSVPLALTGAGTYEVTVSFEAAAGAAAAVADSANSTVIIELSPPRALPVHPPPGWLATDVLEHAIVDWDAVAAVERRVRLVFVGDLRGVDGMKVVQLQQLRHLPRAHFDIDYLDLTCDEGDDLPFLPQLRAIRVAVRRVCVRVAMGNQQFALALRTLHRAPSFGVLDTALRDAFAELYALLRGGGGGGGELQRRRVDAIVLSNSAGVSDNYIFDIARLAGVPVRLLDLGAKLIPNVGINATGFIAPSHYVKHHESVAAVPMPAYVVSPAVDFVRFNRSAVSPCFAEVLAESRAAETVEEAKAEAMLAGPEDGPIVAYLGRLATEKSPGMFLRAVLLLQKANPSVRALIVGDGPLGDAMRRVVASKSQARVHFVRTVSHARIPCILKAVDVLVVPSVNTETFGLVGAEAMAMGVPVVSFGIGGVGEYMQHMRTAYLANGTTPMALAKAMAAVLRDPTLGRQLAAEGYRHIRERFSLGPVIRRYSALYASLAIEARKQQNKEPVAGRSGVCDGTDTGATARDGGNSGATKAQEGGSIQPLYIALHAQVSSKESGRVVGSEITCAGFSRALRARGHNTHIFHPFSYANLTDATWDIVLIEGWFEMFDSFVHEVRRLNPGVRVYFFCFDPAFPGMEKLTRLDVDGYFTNSGEMLRTLSPLVRSEEIPLAADVEAMKPWPHAVPEYAHNVTFVGTAGFEAKVNLSWMLREAAPFGLAIYGSAWDSSPEFAPYWRGVLPKEHIPQLYSSSKVVLGVTMDSQRDHGMVNNRVFEALSCGAVFLSEHFPELEALFGDTILYARGPGDVRDQLKAVLEGSATRPRSGRDLVRRKHTYDHRVAQILDFDAARPLRDEEVGGCGRRNCPRLAVLAAQPGSDDFVIEHVAWEFSLQPALQRLASVYHVTMFDIDAIKGRVADESLFAQFDLLLVASTWGGQTERFARAHLSKVEAKPRSALLLWGSELPVDEHEARTYDVMFYRSERDKKLLEPFHPNLQHACGLDEEMLKSLLPSAHRLGTVCIAEKLSEEQAKLLTARSGRVLVVARTGGVREAVLQHLLQHDVDVVFDLTAEELVTTIRRTEQMLLLGCSPFVVEFAALVALSLNVKVEMSRSDAMSARLTNLGLGWDLDQFEEQLRLGVSRLFCYGTGRTDVQLRKPLHGAAVSGIVILDFDISHFAVRRDGAACLFIDGKIEICLQQPHLRIALNLTQARAPAHFNISLGLVSNVYTGENHNQLPAQRVPSTDEFLPSLLLQMSFAPAATPRSAWAHKPP